MPLCGPKKVGRGDQGTKPRSRGRMNAVACILTFHHRMSKKPKNLEEYIRALPKLRKHAASAIAQVFGEDPILNPGTDRENARAPGLKPEVKAQQMEHFRQLLA